MNVPRDAVLTWNLEMQSLLAYIPDIYRPLAEKEGLQYPTTQTFQRIHGTSSNSFIFRMIVLT